MTVAQNRVPEPTQRRTMRFLVLALGAVTAISGAAPLLVRALADNSNPPTVQIASDGVEPRQVEDTTQQNITKIYSRSWQDLDKALSKNDASALAPSFVGFARDRFASQIKGQQASGISSRVIARKHDAKTVFYSVEGSALEIHDNVEVERQILDGSKVVSSEVKMVPYVAILTTTDDGWKIRLLEQAQD
jgi:hypothetical protein